jgi:glycosyltransferase 2 family protein
MTDDAPKPRSRKHRLSAIVVGLVLSAGFIVLILAKIDLAQVVDELGRVNLWIVGLPLLSSGLGYLMMTGRTAVLLRPLHPYPLLRLFKSVLVGFAGNNVLPLRMGELLRVEYLARHGDQPYSACLAVVAVERIFDLFCLVLCFFCLLPLALEQMPSTTTLAVTGVGLCAAFVVFVVIARRRERFIGACKAATGWMGSRVSNWVAAKADLFAQGLGSLGSMARVLGALGFSFGFWLTTLLGIQLYLWAFGLQGLPWYSPVVVIVFLAFGNALPAAPAFIGTYHYFAMLALTLLGVDDARAGALAIVAHAMGVIPYTVFALFLLLGEILRGEFSRGAGASPAS